MNGLRHLLHWVFDFFTNTKQKGISMNDKVSQLFAKIAALGASDVNMRIEAHVKAKTGNKLSAYLTSGASEADKIALIDEITSIVDSRDWSRFAGGVPSGQVSAPPPVESAAKNAAAALFGSGKLPSGTTVVAVDAENPDGVTVGTVEAEQPKTAPAIKASVAKKKGSNQEVLAKLTELLSDLTPEVDEDAIKAEARAELIGEIKPKILDIAKSAAAIARALKEIHDTLN